MNSKGLKITSAVIMLEMGFKTAFFQEAEVILIMKLRKDS